MKIEITKVIWADDRSLWVTGVVDGIRLGAWIEPDGKILLDDHQSWSIDQDFEYAGIDPDSPRAAGITNIWRSYLAEWRDNWHPPIENEAVNEHH